MKSSKGIVAQVTPLADRVASELGYFVWDVDYVKEGTEWFLRIEGRCGGLWNFNQ
jgi:ribosome maturation factor RimP